MKDQLTDPVAKALCLRLELRTAFLNAIELAELRCAPDSLSVPWYQMQGIWESIKDTRSLGTPVPDAFSAKIQRRLASTMPPRPIVQPTPEEAYRHFKRMIEDGIRVVNVLKYSDPQSLLVRDILCLWSGMNDLGADRVVELRHDLPGAKATALSLHPLAIAKLPHPRHGGPRQSQHPATS